ncbi:MAG TPA: iron ABC transporter permease [Clostridium sp.]|uniref:FecCD family ABC transporter permease n=1 Tax=Clostridium lapidicellarium TaxID=3240931 RepID=A0ABV4DYA2_9CLOT|nr:iron ABC transporter permease [uncultured Clostridium sp.]NLU06640.1 iron ABC transporter permease [Clostridiales bacterium]HBC97393.1 iron ABC transporter permease [Clostridium sp.]
MIEPLDLYEGKFEQRKTIYFILITTTLLIITILVSLTIGKYSISLPQFFNALVSKILGRSAAKANVVETVLFDVRAPRILSALMVGAALSVSGTTYQGLFRNPMVSPDILGASAGAGFGAALGILLSFNDFGIQVSAFLFGLTAVMITYLISTMISRDNNATLVLVLTGMVVAALFTSFTSITKYVADPYEKLPLITFYLMGGLDAVTVKDVKILLVPMVIGLIPLILLRWKFNVISFGDEEAESLGVDTSKLRLVSILCSTLMTAGAVSISGMIGWVGLVIPHIARMIVGPNFKILLPASLLIGSIFLLLVDDIARCAFPVEIPLGILTSLIGAPFFIYLLIKGKKGWA